MLCTTAQYYASPCTTAQDYASPWTTAKVQGKVEEGEENGRALQDGAGPCHHPGVEVQAAGGHGREEGAGSGDPAAQQEVRQGEESSKVLQQWIWRRTITARG